MYIATPQRAPGREWKRALDKSGIIIIETRDSGERASPTFPKLYPISLYRHMNMCATKKRFRRHWLSKSKHISSFRTFGVFKSFSRVRLFAIPWTVAHQAPPSMGFSRQEYWSGLPFPSPEDLPDLGIESRSPTLQADALTSEPPGTLFSRLQNKLPPSPFLSHL